MSKSYLERFEGFDDFQPVRNVDYYRLEPDGELVYKSIPVEESESFGYSLKAGGARHEVVYLEGKLAQPTPVATPNGVRICTHLRLRFTYQPTRVRPFSFPGIVECLSVNDHIADANPLLPLSTWSIPGALWGTPFCFEHPRTLKPYRPDPDLVTQIEAQHKCSYDELDRQDEIVREIWRRMVADY